jgi:hypothetical protein
MGTREQTQNQRHNNYEGDVIVYGEGGEYYTPDSYFDEHPSNSTIRRRATHSDDVHDDRRDYTTYSKSVPRRRSASQTTEFYTPRPVEPGPRFVRHNQHGDVVDEYGDVVPSRRSQSPSRRLQQQQVQPHTTQPRVQRVQPQRTTGPVVSRRFVTKLLTGTIVAAAAGGLATVPHLMEQHSLDQNHFHQGDDPVKSLSQAVGHNSDSNSKPTIMNLRVVDRQLVFEEIPAGEKPKTKETPLATLASLGYTGNIADLFLSINLSQVGTRYQVLLSVQWYERTWLVFYAMTQPKSAVLVDLGHGYFEVPSSK